MDEPNAWPPWREATVVLKGSDISNRGQLTRIFDISLFPLTYLHSLAHHLRPVKDARLGTYFCWNYCDRKHSEYIFCLILCLLTSAKTESSYKLQLDDRIVCVRFANEVVGTNFYRQLSHFIQHGPVVNEQEKDALNAEAAEISRSGSWIVL